MVSAAAVPPLAETCIRPPTEFPKMITPSRFHEPPTTSPGTSQIVSAGPPEMAIFLSVLPPSNAINRLSGDQKNGGNAGDSEPNKGLPVGAEVRLCISHHDATFTALGVVASCQPNMGMGVRFTNVQLDQHATLDKWLAELV